MEDSENLTSCIKDDRIEVVLYFKESDEEKIGMAYEEEVELEGGKLEESIEGVMGRITLCS